MNWLNNISIPKPFENNNLNNIVALGGAGSLIAPALPIIALGSSTFLAGAGTLVLPASGLAVSGINLGITTGYIKPSMFESLFQPNKREINGIQIKEGSNEELLYKERKLQVDKNRKKFFIILGIIIFIIVVIVIANK